VGIASLNAVCGLDESISAVLQCFTQSTLYDISNTTDRYISLSKTIIMRNKTTVAMLVWKIDAVEVRGTGMGY